MVQGGFLTGKRAGTILTLEIVSSKDIGPTKWGCLTAYIDKSEETNNGGDFNDEGN